MFSLWQIYQKFRANLLVANLALKEMVNSEIGIFLGTSRKSNPSFLAPKTPSKMP